MQKKGGVGVVAVMLSAHNIIDLVKIMLPAPVTTRLSQAADNWGDMWVRLRPIPCSVVFVVYLIFQLPRLQQAIEKD